MAIRQSIVRPVTFTLLTLPPGISPSDLWWPYNSAQDMAQELLVREGLERLWQKSLCVYLR